jgi:hypothetical protein
METLTEAEQRLRHAGFVADLRATPGRPPLSVVRRDPRIGVVGGEETVRFEGDSNPDDEAILLALSYPNGCLGQFSSAFDRERPSQMRW